MTRRSPNEVIKQKAAWHQAAMAWRTKNKPSDPELQARKQEENAGKDRYKRSFEPPRQRWTGFDRSKFKDGAAGAGTNATGGSKQQQQPPPPPPVDAADTDKRAYYRVLNQNKLSTGLTFTQVCTFVYNVLYSFKAKCNY